MKLPEYDQWDATEMAAKVRAGELSPAELTEAAIERIEARNPQLNCVVDKLYERARERADKLPDGPFKGVPMLLKDLKLQLKGTVTTNSTKLKANERATASSRTAERYEAAGLSVVGKSNTPEFGILGVTEPELRGPCRNPWSLDHTPGGSSGGSSSAIAARIVPVAHAGDGGGSIRIPASCTGLFGLKPTRGRVSQAPFRGHSWGGFVQEHTLTRTVRDSAAMLDIEDELTRGEPYAPPRKHVESWTSNLGQDPGRLRIGFCREALYAGTTHPECMAALDDAIALLQELGHEVVEAKPDYDREAMVLAYFRTVAAGTADFVTATSRAAGKSPSASDYEAPTWLLAQIGWATTAAEYVASEGVMHQACRSVASFFDDHDMFLTPTVAEPPLEIGALELTGSERTQLSLLRVLNLRPLLMQALQQLGTNALARTPNTQLFNQTGHPAMSVPLYWSKAGLPIGVQLAGRWAREDQLFQLAAQLERARPWAQKLPPMLSS